MININQFAEMAGKIKVSTSVKEFPGSIPFPIKSQLIEENRKKKKKEI